MSMENKKLDLERVSLMVNQLHHEAQAQAGDARTAMSLGVLAGWAGGRLIHYQKKKCRRGTWSTWLDTQFEGSARTAQRYMSLAKKMKSLEELKGISLRQAYLRLGVAMTPTPGRGVCSEVVIPEFVILANKLTRVLRRNKCINEGLDDLWKLYRELEVYFKNQI